MKSIVDWWSKPPIEVNQIWVHKIYNTEYLIHSTNGDFVVMWAYENKTFLTASTHFITRNYTFKEYAK